jgi:hypothetical protein
LQSVISLQGACNAKKIIVTVTEDSVELVSYWRITFSDNTFILLKKVIVESIELDEITEEYTITLLDEQQLVFNRKEPIIPTGVVVLTPNIRFLKNMEVAVEFRVNPSNAVFNYDIISQDCQIQLDMAGSALTYSYVTNPKQCRLVRIEQAKHVNGTIKEGQYTAYVADNNSSSAYKYTLALVLSTQDIHGNPVQFSSHPIALERKKDTGLPIVVIHTENKAEIMDKTTWVPAKMKIYGVSSLPVYEGMDQFRSGLRSQLGVRRIKQSAYVAFHIFFYEPLLVCIR